MLTEMSANIGRHEANTNLLGARETDFDLDVFLFHRNYIEAKWISYAIILR